MTETPVDQEISEDAQKDPSDKAEKGSDAALQTSSGGGVAVVTPDKGGKNTKSAILAESVEIFPGEALPEYDCGLIKAYRAQSLKGREEYVAYVCERFLPPRVKDANLYTGIINPMMAKLVKYGVAYWPPAKQERMVFVYSNITGERLLKPGALAAMGWRQEKVMEQVVHPLVGVLQDFRDKGFTHGFISPINMFGGVKTGGGSGVVLGDCLSSPCSYNQPLLYETIERSMVDPIGRGKGTLADDIYAFGVSLAVSLRSHDPLKDMSRDDIIRHKIEYGSYFTVTGKDRFKGSILELLRGVLLDDPVQRWTIDDVVSWLDGVRLTPRQSVKQKKAQRPLAFNNEKYFYSSILAMDIDLNPQETQRLVENEDLQQWLERAMEDEESVERVELAIRSSREGGTGPGYEERLVANLSTALDPFAPIRFRGLRLLADSVGNALAEAMVLKQDINPFVEMFQQQIALNWLGIQKGGAVDTGALIPKFDQCRTAVRQAKVGYGIERALYILAPNVHCLSEKLAEYFVRSPEDMIFAFEDIAEKGKAPTVLLDRHSIAFIYVKDSSSIEPYLHELASPEQHKRILGGLKTLATIQKRCALPPMPHLAKAVAETLPAVYKRYHDRQVQEKLEKSVKRYAADGDLVKMAGLMDNIDVVNKDFSAFKSAMLEYSQLKQEIENLDKHLENKSSFGRGTAREVAALIASALAGIIILFTAFTMLTGHSMF